MKRFMHLSVVVCACLVQNVFVDGSSFAAIRQSFEAPSTQPQVSRPAPRRGVSAPIQHTGAGQSQPIGNTSQPTTRNVPLYKRQQVEAQASYGNRQTHNINQTTNISPQPTTAVHVPAYGRQPTGSKFGTQVSHAVRGNVVEEQKSFENQNARINRPVFNRVAGMPVQPQVNPNFPVKSNERNSRQLPLPPTKGHAKTILANPRQSQDAQKACQNLLERSEQFFVNHKANYKRFNIESFTNHNRLEKVHKGDWHGILADAKGTRIIMHRAVYDMIKKHVNNTGLGVSTEEYIKHLIRDVPLTFYMATHENVPRFDANGQIIVSPNEKAWENHTNPNYLTLSEMRLASLLQISSPTRFINDCERSRWGQPGVSGSFIEKGYITSVVGPQVINDPEELDTKYLILHAGSTKPPANTIERILFDYYTENGESWNTIDDLPDMDPIEREQRYTELYRNLYIDWFVFSKRARLSIIPFLMDADERAKKGVVLVTPWGDYASGSVEFELKFIKEVVKVAEELHETGKIKNITNIIFTKFEDYVEDDLDGIMDEIKKERSGRPLRLSYRLASVDAADKEMMEELVGDLKDKTVFYSIPWTGNSYPGNRYWIGKCPDKIDAAAACCSTIGETQNPQINPEFMDRIKVFE